jgi:hypothetical protein
MMTGSAFSSQILRGRGRTYSPNLDLDGKQNFTRHVFIDRDGGIKEVVRLNVLDDRHREEIVAFQFARQYAEIHYRNQLEKPQFYIVGRDCPWDFEYVMHDGTTFFLEICRMADKGLLKAIRAENEFSTLMGKGTVRGYEVLKLEKNFPGSVPKHVLEEIGGKAGKQKLFTLHEKETSGPRLFLRSPINPHVDLEAGIRSAINKKTAKRHAGKDRTILVIDNLTTHSEPDEMFDAAEKLHDFLDAVPFPSIWIYTGYYSDNNGFDCEYSLTPIKLTGAEWRHFDRSEDPSPGAD